MSYGTSAALQLAVFQQMSNDPGLIALVGDAIYDALPSGPLPPLYVVLGTESARDASDKTGGGALFEFMITVVTETAGFASAKVAAAAVSDVLVDAPLQLNRGRLVSLNFYKAKAARVGSGDVRQINLTFRARVADDT
ncbi:DUF3168 domain-containing protein [Yoonia sediminilitoris]|uniref:Uncharacterized protein DUF3168 n=1 Tax=Yoonia sediminilitoris TaxID=1286148 RepID=A0A2T6KDK0_9RHOB|nr:DUF3168 domain-containing protein [Yoonia sediminilitoris]PUB13129.1 uncharacterized protein DUF3168 [Yoonia sediminilitoris]RCW94464.1 uncharacterized protein DUF3168 [Yoonia sediminilitoris]